METPAIEGNLIEALQPIRGFVLATGIYHFFETGLYEALMSCQPQSVHALELALGYEREKLQALLKFLRNEGIVDECADGFLLSTKGQALEMFRPWYTMLIGGYGRTFLELGDVLRNPQMWASRDAMRVGVGSCGISHYDSIPLTRRLMSYADRPLTRLLDMGCGNGLYLVEFCKAHPEITAWGIEPDLGGYQQAVELIHQHHLEDRITLTCSSAIDALGSAAIDTPDLAVFGFVLHEILGQEGEAEVVRFLSQLVERFPNIYIIVIEVDHQVDSPAHMRHGLGLAYYNPYYLFHPFTRQRLETQCFWERLFARCGLTIAARERVDPHVDSTGLEIGYLLRKEI